MRRRRGWILGLVLGLALSPLLFCGVGGLAIKQKLIEPPSVSLTIRGIGLIAKTTDVPSCTIAFLDCTQYSRLSDNEVMYAIWVVWKPARSARESPGARRLLAMRLVR
jgi:hypothetical protein